MSKIDTDQLETLSKGRDPEQNKDSDQSRSKYKVEDSSNIPKSGPMPHFLNVSITLCHGKFWSVLGSTERHTLSGNSLDKNTSCQGRGVGIQKYSEEQEEANENNKTEKHGIVSGWNSSEY